MPFLMFALMFEIDNVTNYIELNVQKRISLVFWYDFVMHAMHILLWLCYACYENCVVLSVCKFPASFLSSSGYGHLLIEKKTFQSASGLSFWQNQAFVIVSRSSQNRHTQRKSQKNSQRFQKGMTVFQISWVGSLLSHGFQSEAFVPAHHLPLYFDAMLLLM